MFMHVQIYRLPIFKIFVARLKTFTVTRSFYNYLKGKLLEIHGAFMTVFEFF